jgi:hypothetical protein
MVHAKVEPDNTIAQVSYPSIYRERNYSQVFLIKGLSVEKLIEID